MLIVFMLAAAVFAVWAACFRPTWFFVALIGIPITLAMVGRGLGEDSTAIQFGPLTVRLMDPCALGLVAGILYHGHSRVWRVSGSRAGGRVARWIALYLGLKVIATMMFAGQIIASNGLSNSWGGGVIAAAGEVRDNFLAILAPLLVVVCARHITAERLRKPFIILVGIIVTTAVVRLARGEAQIWSGMGESRFIGAGEAITLALVSFFLYCMPGRTQNRGRVRFVAIVAFAIAILANHRSVWLASCIGLAVLITATIRGNVPTVRKKTAWIVLLLTGFGAVALILMRGNGAMTDEGGLDTRMLAFTDPVSDSDSAWRMGLWMARVQGVADDWVFGRFLGDRPVTLLNGQWIAAPDHSAYVSAFEMGGLCLLLVVFRFWTDLIRTAWNMIRARGAKDPSGALALAMIAASLAHGVAYDFPLLGPSLAVLLLMRRPVLPALARIRKVMLAPVNPAFELGSAKESTT